MKHPTFTADGLLWKAFVGDDKKTMYVVVKASDNEIDLQRDIISESVFQDVIQDAKRGEIRLTASHHVPFGFGESVDAWTETDERGITSLYIMFKLKENYGESYDLFNDVVNGKGNLYQVSVGGKIMDYLYKTDPRYGVIRVITKAKVNHVAVTWAGMVANPRTGIVQAMAKALELWEKEMNLNPTLLAKDNDEDDDEEEEKKSVVVSEDEEDIEVKETLRKEFVRLWDKLESERRAVTPTEEDLEEQERRAQQYRIEVSPVGFAVKPSPFAGIPDGKFADPVNYLFPVTSAKDAKMYLLVWQQNPHLWKGIYHNIESAGRVFANLCRLAKEHGVNIPRNHPAIYLVPRDFVQLIAEVTEITWHDIIHKSLLDEAKKEEELLTGTLLLKAEDDKEKLRQKLMERAKKYGYDPAPNAHLTKPAEYAHIPESQFADPVGYNYPIDKEHVLAAIRYFLKPYNRNFYDPKAQKIIYERILRAMKRYGHNHRFDPDNPLDWLMPQSLKRWMVGYEKYEDEDTEEKRKEMEKRLEREYKRYRREREKQMLAKTFLPFASVLNELLDENQERAVDLLYKAIEKETTLGYLMHPAAALTPEDGRSDEDYADPVSYLFPISTSDEAAESLEKFLAERNYYPPETQIAIYKRILAKTRKVFDPSNPLDWVVAAESPELLIAPPSEINPDQVRESRNQMEREFIAAATDEYNYLMRISNALDYLKALIDRRCHVLLSKTLTTEGATSGENRGIFGYWVIGQEGQKVAKPGPITYVIPMERFPLKARKKGQKYAVTDLSTPVAVVKEGVKKVAEMLQNLQGAEIEIKKSAESDNVYEFLVTNYPIKYILTIGDDDALLEEVVTIKDTLPKELIGVTHFSKTFADAIAKMHPDAKVEIAAIGTNFIAYELSEGDKKVTYLVPYAIDADGNIVLDFENKSAVKPLG